jgi:hypothetical protein
MFRMQEVNLYIGIRGLVLFHGKEKTDEPHHKG